MKKNLLLRVAAIILVLVTPIASGNAQDNGGRRTSLQNQIYGNPGGKSKIKKKPVSIKRAKKEQEARIKKNKKEYAELVKENRKHAFEIQSPEVKDRMKNNRKDSDSRYREKRKMNAMNSRKAGRKYR